jgi:2'-5' RNA ligase
MMENASYIVLEIPPVVGEIIHDIRRRYDPRMARLPIEITVAGSSGVGLLSAGQDDAFVHAAIQDVARHHLPLTTSFTAISSFPGTTIHWLRPADPEPFQRIQIALVTAGLKFDAHKFGYTPHCTLSTGELTTTQQANLFHEPFPVAPFLISTLAIYLKSGDDAVLVRNFPA